jgi:protein NRD1
MPKPMGYDPKIPNGKIRGRLPKSKRHQRLTCPVLSRTLFVGGVSAKTNETELKHFFSRFGNVQSCIVNHDKRHAFLKLISHQDAQVTKQAVDMLPSDEYRGKFERVSALSTSI